MRTVTPLAAGDGFRVERLTIRAATEDWTEPDLPPGYRMTLVRGGVFRARVGGHVFLADPVTAYLGGPADEQSIAHRAGARDVCTALLLAPSFLAELTGGVRVPPTATVSGRLAVTHRLLLARARHGADPFTLAELTAHLVGGLFAATPPLASTETAKPSTVAARRALAESARELLAREPAALGLRETARRLGCSPYHLSRVFHRQTGLTLTAYRTRVRVLRALDAIEEGHTDLAALAADLGFADHAHLTRTVRRECGHTPRSLRRLLESD